MSRVTSSEDHCVLRHGDDVDKLHYLALVNKVCQELDAHLGLPDKTLAEFIIDIAQEHPDHARFHEKLAENGADFPTSLETQLLMLCKMAHTERSDQLRGMSGSVSEASFQHALPSLDPMNDSPADSGLVGRTDPACGSQKARPAAGGLAADESPLPGKIYSGKVSNVLDFGCFVQVRGVKARPEGLVHASLIGPGHACNPHDTVKRGQLCYVKVKTAPAPVRSHTLIQISIIF